ncbi:hypothetical protein Taro_021069 [Colocasia esculenta]|uniref:GRF-type domain-containing protein n=1 Tax=Colocasia esculenta TaxID=4460 RepID=A0A843V0D9_COLES|nr:hypothetical protein [Colocasia esculenta]
MAISMEHKNAASDASEVGEGNNISSVSPGTPAQNPTTSIIFQGWKPPAQQQSSSDRPSPLFGSATFGSSAASTLFGAAPLSSQETGPNGSNARPSGTFQFPPCSRQMPSLSFGQEAPPPPCPEPPSDSPTEGKGKPAAPTLFSGGLFSSPSPAMPGFTSFASSSAPEMFQFPPQASPPASGSNPPPVFPSFGGSTPAFGCFIGGATVPAFGGSTGGAAGASSPAFGCSTRAIGGSTASAQAFGCSSSATTSPAFGCPQVQSLFATPATATRTAGPCSFTINSPGVPAGLSNGFNQVQWTMPGSTHPWANPLPLNAKRCYCGKVAGVRFSNTTDGTLGLFYCCPDYNEEAIRNGTQDRNYCTYTEWSNGFSLVRKCYCGKVAVLQKSDMFGTWGKLFYSCPEYREKEVVFGRCNRRHCSYIEWSSSSSAPAPAPVQLFG